MKAEKAFYILLENKLMHLKRELEKAVRKEEYYKADKFKFAYDEFKEIIEELRDIME